MPPRCLLRRGNHQSIRLDGQQYRIIAHTRYGNISKIKECGLITAEKLNIRARLVDLYPDGLPNVDLSVAIALEAERLANKYGKDAFDCNDLVTILGVGRNNIRELMRSNHFPTLTIGGRKVVSAIALAKWLLNDYLLGNTS